MSDKPHQFSIKPDGLMFVTTGADGKLYVQSDQPITIDLKTISSVGIENLVHVKSHEINELYNFISHLVRFRDGGEVEFAYNSDGVLLKCQGRKVLAVVQNGERLIFKMKPQTA